jgi:hypothetical protein
MSTDWPGVGRYVKSGQLSVQSAYNHFPEDEGRDVAGKKLHAAKSVKNAFVIICPTAVTEYVKASVPKSVTKESKVNSIMKLEASVGDQFSNSVVVCCVFDRFVQSLDLASLLILMKYHALAVRHDDKIIPLSDPDVIDTIRKGMGVLGVGSSTLILKTLQHVYNIDERAILQEPFIWCNVLKKICGEDSANLILNAIAEEMRKLMMQGNPPDGK